MRTEILNVGDSILLYSDGLIERPGRPLAASTAEFADLAANIAGGSGGFVIDAGARPIDRICSEHLNCCSGQPATTTMSHCLRCNGVRHRRRCT